MIVHTKDVYDCQDPRCLDWVSLGLAQDRGTPEWHTPGEQTKHTKGNCQHADCHGGRV